MIITYLQKVSKKHRLGSAECRDHPCLLQWNICYRSHEKEPADLIISDIEMPDLDGISMSRQALEINPMVKIILISAYDKFEYARRALLLGALDYIEKPLDYTYLIQKVKTLLH